MSHRGKEVIKKMGVYGFTEINIEYDDKATDDQIKAFLDELKANDNLYIKEIKPPSFVVLESGRVQNLTYQEELFNQIVKKHSCVLEAIGDAFVEAESDIYYTRGSKE